MDIINYARQQIEDVSFSSDIIVGFPGETFEEYLDTEKLVKDEEQNKKRQDPER